MAGQVSHQLAAVASMASNPLSPVAKAAQKQLSAVIKAKKRCEARNALRVAAVREATSRQDPDHGEHIWIYKHMQTNQVIYSLDKTLKVSPFIHVDAINRC